MKKNLIDKTAVDEIVARIQLLQPNSKAIWGTMQPTEMLTHCNLANTGILSGELKFRKSNFKQFILRNLFVYVINKYPKNIEGPKAIDMKNRNISPEKFAEEQQRFIALLQKFPEFVAPKEMAHPVFGKLTTKQWGLFSWMHMDHHLRQFGI